MATAAEPCGHEVRGALLNPAEDDLPIRIPARDSNITATASMGPLGLSLV
jgi:hypothetical protein